MKTIISSFISVLLGMAVMSSSFTGRKSSDNIKAGTHMDQTARTDTKMVIIAKLPVKPEKTKNFIAAAREIIEKSNKETGCTSYQLYQDPYDQSKFVFVEEYKNQAAVDAHFATEYFKAFSPKIADFVSGPAVIKIVTVASEVLK
jgi:quinol monooxygenase YgiN